MELVTIMIVIAALASIAIPTFAVWLPNYKLRSAARDLYSNLQMAKLNAVKHNKEWAVVFVQGSNQYFVCSDDGGAGWDNCPEANKEKIVNLGDYEDIYFGHANINKDILDVVFTSGDHVSYTSDWVVFGSRGTADKGYVYVQNDKDTVYGVGTRPSGVIHLKKWTGSVWD